MKKAVNTGILSVTPLSDSNFRIVNRLSAMTISPGSKSPESFVCLFVFNDASLASNKVLL